MYCDGINWQEILLELTHNRWSQCTTKQRKQELTRMRGGWRVSTTPSPSTLLSQSIHFLTSVHYKKSHPNCLWQPYTECYTPRMTKYTGWIPWGRSGHGFCFFWVYVSDNIEKMPIQSAFLAPTHQPTRVARNMKWEFLHTEHKQAGDSSVDLRGVSSVQFSSVQVEMTLDHID